MVPLTVAQGQTGILPRLWSPNVRSLLACFVQNQRGATAIEYGLIAGVVTLAVMGGIAATGTSVGELFAAAIARIIAVL
jgi:pilus assembly protein Flp/PilA